MPSSGWRKKKLGSISRLLSSMARRKIGDSRLVVQTGFPTSIADLVVKNRTRLRKSLWIRSPDVADQKIWAGGAENCVRSLPDSSDDSMARLQEDEPRQDGIGEEMSKDDLPPFELGENEIAVEGKPKSSLDRGSRFQRWKMAVKIGFIFLILALVTKKIALGISISAIIVMFLESLGRRLILLFRSCKILNENRRLCDFEVFQIPPCTIVAIGQFQDNCSLEQENLNSGSKKTKNLLKRIVLKKLRPIKREISSDSRTIRGKVQEEDEDEIVPSFGVSSKVDVADFPAEMVVHSRNQTSRRLILLLVVLLGLVGGRFAAMATTITLYSVGTSARRLLKNMKTSAIQSQ